MTKQIMDHMDIDDIVDVPDTPDRLAAQRIKEENHRSSFPYNNPWQQKFSEEGAKNEPMVIDGGKGKLPLHPPKPNSTSSSSSSRNANLFRKGVIEKNPSFQNRDTNNAANTQYSSRLVRPLSTSKSSYCQHDGLIDLTERDLQRPVRPVSGNDSPSKVSENIRAEFKKRSGLANGSSSLHGLDNFPTSSYNNANEKRDSVNGVGSSTVFGERTDFVGNNQKKPVSNGFLSRDSIASPKVNRQKRLVRNGCISPNNIAKAEKLSGMDNNGSVAVGCHNNGSVASSAPVIPDLIRELVAEDSESYARKGKGVVNHPCSSKGSDINNKNPHGRSYMGFNDNACKSTEEPSGWRSTRNRTAEINLLSPDKDQFSSQHHENRLERRGKATSVANGDNNYPKDTNMTSSEHVSAQPPRARLGRLNGPRSVKDTVIKRQKQGSTSSTYGECSTSVSTDPEVVFLSSSQEAANSKSTSRSTNNLQPIIEVDESSLELRRNEDARKRQVEADERLARELQEQLYSELPAFGAFGAAEMDENIALALQNQDDSSNRFSRARHHVLDPRVSTSRSSSSNVARRGALARASTLGRMTRLRSRFPGQPRTVLPSRGRASIFPADMDVEMRMHILGALEELSGLEVSPGMLQSHRDFNENDYEMLLALDENNDRHGGASAHQINGLPQSTVQTDNFEEACAICLDTPTIGDTIRHLPCLHKFHKDCIDPWLKRKTSCPVCKSSVT